MLNFIYLQFLVEHIRSYRFLYFRRTRQRQNKFLGRTIQHEWIVDEASQQKEWYKGTVMSVISGNDGKLNANKKIFNIHCCTCFECYFSINIK
jgi:hypothetical protein